MQYILSELPPVESVEILRFGDNEESMSSCARVSGDVANQIAELWRQLPFAGQMRCHIPPYALRFFYGEHELLIASICWECNNIWITENGQRKYAEFDAQAEVSQQLFQLIESISTGAR